MVVEFKKAYRRAETKSVITLGLVFAFFCLVESILCTNLCFPLSAFQTAMAYNGKTAELFSSIILPIIAVLPFADSYYCENKYGVYICYLTRAARSRYFLFKALAVFITSFMAICIPYIFNQLYCMIAFPMERSRDIVLGTMYDQNWLYELRSTPSPELLMNQPAIRNLLHILFAGFYGGSIGLIGFSLSLFIQKSRVIANVLPVVICYAWTVLALRLLGNDYVPALGIGMGLNQKIQSYALMIAVVGIGYIVCFVSIFIKCKRDML